MNAKKKVGEHLIDIGKIVGVVIAIYGAGFAIAKPHIDNHIKSVHTMASAEQNKAHMIQIEETQKHIKKLQEDVIYLKFLVIENLTSEQLAAAKNKYEAYKSK